MLKVKNLSVSYGDIPALKNVTINVPKGDVVSVLGANGAGKTTVLKTISGLLKAEPGSEIQFLGEPITDLSPNEIVKRGIVHLPEGRQVFPDLTVLENIEVGSICRSDRANVRREMDELFQVFTELLGKERQLAGTLSGGEQQMLAVARALIAAPKLLMVDEPSMGLAPVVVKRIFDLLKRVQAERGITILLVEQNAYMSMAICNSAYILSQGQIELYGLVEELREDTRIKETYLGRTAK